MMNDPDAQPADVVGGDVTVRLSGLAPDTEYLSHLHAQACRWDNGGDHFTFELDGSDAPMTSRSAREHPR